MNAQKKLANAMLNHSELVKEYWLLKKTIQNSEPSLERMVMEERFAELKNILNF